MPQAPWSASAVDARAVASLLPYAGNARTHSAEQAVELQCEFDVPVRFDTDDMDVELRTLFSQRWSSIRLIEVRP